MTNDRAPTTVLLYYCITVLNEKAADMISRLCSMVESLAEKLFLACPGGRGVATPGARGQFGGAGHLGYRALQLQVEIGHPLLRLVCAVSRSQRFVPDPRANPGEVFFNHLRGDLVIGIFFVKLGGEFSERFQHIVGDGKLVRFEFVIVFEAVELELRVRRDLSTDQVAHEQKDALRELDLQGREVIRREEVR